MDTYGIQDCGNVLRFAMYRIFADILQRNKHTEMHGLTVGSFDVVLYPGHIGVCFMSVSCLSMNWTVFLSTTIDCVQFKLNVLQVMELLDPI